ncbi:hypothetical protein SZMC14600_13167 [Saccharomonospora azurea SZMC 14600]|nr:hypothetical protein SZMC14600_13167 [Saccharomonospora azurea SZMC 14600]
MAARTSQATIQGNEMLPMEISPKTNPERASVTGWKTLLMPSSTEPRRPPSAARTVVVVSPVTPGGLGETATLVMTDMVR